MSAKNENDPPKEPVPEGDPAAAPDAKPTGADDDWAGDPEPSDELGEVPDYAAGMAASDEKTRVEVLQADPTTPYHAATSFEDIGLPENLLKGIYNLKFSKPSKIQATSLPMILASPDGDYKNLIAQGHNGSGKTACFVLGLLSRIDFDKAIPQGICLVPTRELARQIIDVIMQLGKFTKVTTRVAVKATEEEKAAARRNDGIRPVTEHIVVGTPGKIMELVKKRMLNANTLKTMVLDEADEMVDTQGMGDQTLRIRQMLPKAMQVLLFSATYKDEVRTLAQAIAPAANQIAIKRETLSLDKIKQYYMEMGSKEERFSVVADIYSLLSLGQSIIFVRTRVDAASLASRLRNAGHAVSVLYGGDMRPEERDRVIDEFRMGTTRVLVTTNVLSRGVDVLAVNAVINYDLPTERTGQRADPETYLHRIGRTGRFGRKGIAINFVYNDPTKRVLKELQEYYSKKIEKVEDVEELSDRIRNL